MSLIASFNESIVVIIIFTHWSDGEVVKSKTITPVLLTLASRHNQRLFLSSFFT